MENMHIRFLLGPAGSGKTWRCVDEIRQELLRAPDGPPLILLAPRQATFQLEYQLLAGGSLPGYTRLSIFSFARLADHLLELLGKGRPRMLSEEGRVMVLRALLKKYADDNKLKIFHATARLAGFAAELSRWLRELQQHQVSPEHLEAAAKTLEQRETLAAKLQDTALLYRAFQQWLQEQGLADAEGLLPLAAAGLRQAHQQGRPLHIAGLWMDGFAELTPQEADFLAALAPHCARMTLAFCVDQLASEDLSPLHPQAIVARTVQRCADALTALPGAQIQYEQIKCDSARGRFANAPALAHLEHHWATPVPPPFNGQTAEVRLVVCPNPEKEVVFAAREIWRHVRGGGRFREVAVLMRRLESHAALLKRVFQRYEIPFFLDQREPMAHHPLAELTRYALRVMARGWQNADWLGALKTGLVPIAPEALDELENLALELGLEGDRWLSPWNDQQSGAAHFERLREKLVLPFKKLCETLSRPGGVTGGDIARGLRQLYEDLKVAETLQAWAETPGSQPHELPPAAHATVWQTVQDWLDTLELALGDHQLPLPEWLPILESGFSQLSVGIIPPAMDQVLVGAVDRSRQPELKMMILLGLNEGLFPAPPQLPLLLTEEERNQLQQEGKIVLGPGTLGRQGAERYLGYIACTRAANCLVVTRAATDVAGQPLNPSLFYLRLQKMFPQTQEECFDGEVEVRDAVHPSELLSRLLTVAEWPPDIAEKIPAPLSQLRHYAPDEQLSPAVVERLFPQRTLTTSISALETYAACPFRYFVEKVLRAEERPLFALDDMQSGSFLHQVLARFHQAVTLQGKRWRDLTPAEAEKLLAEVAEEVARQFHHGLLEANERHKFKRELLVERLQAYAAQAVQWMSVYQLDPWQVEVAFGMSDDVPGANALPPWSMALEGGGLLQLIGRIDRVDIHRPSDGSPPLAVVIDYKSSDKDLETVRLHHGLDLQLIAYLNVVRSLPELAQAAGGHSLQPLGAFYVSILARPGSASDRAEALEKDDANRSGFPHHGRFDQSFWPILSSTLDGQGRSTGPVSFKTKKGDKAGTFLVAWGKEVLDAATFQNLLEENHQHLRTFASRILSGDMKVDPYQIKDKSACDYCPCSGVCRIDPWRHEFRRLSTPPKSQKNGAAPKKA